MDYKDLSQSRIISVDIETYDPELKQKGTGVYRKDGTIVGVALANEEGWAEYYNFGHPGCSKQEREKNKAYIKEILALPVPKIGANLLYDFDWLINGYGFEANGEWHDIQVAEPLIDEYKLQYNLDSLSWEYLQIGKDLKRLQNYCDTMEWKGEPQSHIWEMPYEIVKPYAVGDAQHPIEIFRIQWQKLREQKLIDLYKLEMRLFPLLLQMKRVGVRIDGDAVTKAIQETTDNIKEGKQELIADYGDVNYNSSQQIAKVLDDNGIPYPLNPPTEKMLKRGIKVGNPNLNKKVLEAMHLPFTDKILELRQADKVRSTFLINSFTHMRVDGRIHTQFNPLRSDDYGTVSGRLSSTDPNLQQIPNKDNQYGIMCRRVFLPEEDCLWGKTDYSQIEYRFMAHFARGPGSDEIRLQYQNEPDTDYHKYIMELTNLDRTRAKNLNFGVAFYMGAASMAGFFGWTLEEAQEMIALYFKMVPFMKPTRKHVVRIAKGRGYIRTILGRRARVSDYIKAERKEYSLFNRLIQGSAADLLKKAMVDAYEAGIYNVLYPHLTVHDELNQSIPRKKEGIEAYQELQYTMEKAIHLKVPIKADPEIGPNWADVKEIKDWSKIL